MRNLPKNNNSGQALLLVLLSMAVVLTVVLSIISRSITDINISSQNSDSLRAFSAAEAGIEQVLIAGASSGNVNISNASFNASISSYSQGVKEFLVPSELLSGDSTYFWFVAHNSQENIVCDATNTCFSGRYVKVCWGKEGTLATSSTAPAIELSIFYAQTPGSYSTMRIARVALDPNSSRRSVNNFDANDSGSCSIDGKTMAFQKTLDLSSLGIPVGSYSVENGLQFAKVRFFYNTDSTHPIALSGDFSGNSTFPAQGIRIDSVGTSGTSTRRVEVYQGYPELPVVFNSSVFGGGGIIQ